MAAALIEARVLTKVWMDAYLAAFAQAAGARLVTNDVAFRAYPILDVVLIGPGTD